MLQHKRWHDVILPAITYSHRGLSTRNLHEEISWNQKSHVAHFLCGKLLKCSKRWLRHIIALFYKCRLGIHSRLQVSWGGGAVWEALSLTFRVETLFLESGSHGAGNGKGNDIFRSVTSCQSPLACTGYGFYLHGKELQFMCATGIYQRFTPLRIMYHCIHVHKLNVQYCHSYTLYYLWNISFVYVPYNHYSVWLLGKLYI